MNNIEYIAKVSVIHNNRYDYYETIYLGIKSKIYIMCKEHGLFQLRADKHLEGRGCPECSRLNKTKSVFDFLCEANEIHNFKYDYSNILYKNNRTNIKIICNKHGLFEQRPDVHLAGAGCWKCTNCVSKIENEWLDYLNIPLYNRQVVIKAPSTWYKVDALFNNHVYEFYGDFWHGNPIIYNSNDCNAQNNISYNVLYNKTINREQSIKKLGYKIISIWESEWKELRKIL